MITTMNDVITLIYKSYLRANGTRKEVQRDEIVRKPHLTRQLLSMIGNVDIDQKIVLVTGSKGKGSTSKMVATILENHGLNVGLFMSPHLIHFNERISINGKSISDDDFIRLANVIQAPVMRMEKSLSNDDYFSPIGIALCIALLYFQENKTDINIIECGRGGRYDDTNVLQNKYAIITPIMEEHVANLGPTLSHIIDHKLGIVKYCTENVIISKQTKALKELKRRKTASWDMYGESFGMDHYKLTTKGSQFTVWTPQRTYEMSMPVLGEFQAVNAATAIRASELILQQVNNALLQHSLQKLYLPGRCEIISTKPLTIVDGAINKETAQQTKNLISTFKSQHIVTIIGVPANKDYEGVIQVASSFSKKIIITKPDVTHLPFDERAFQYAKTIFPSSVTTSSLQDAFALAKKDRNVDLVVILGTQTFISNVKRLTLF